MNKIRSIILTVLWVVTTIVIATGQSIKIPQLKTNIHPRLLTNTETGKKELEQLLKTGPWAKETYTGIKAKIDALLEKTQKDSSYLASRLQMNWNSHYTDAYVKSGVYQYGSGKAPVPTVRLSGTRDAVSAYMRPKLEDIEPFMDEDGKMYLQSKNGAKTWEWVDPSKTGTIAQSVNQEIISIARDAAFLYWYTGDERYAKFALSVFHTYMSGMYYRNEPIDLSKGHDQTLIGLQSFEVIHEDIVIPLSVCYDFLFNYIQKATTKSDREIYNATFKKWADLIIRNGVPFNNWDLIEARFTAHIALILENDNDYADKKGCQHYLNKILNKGETRQWSVLDLIHYGFDPNTGIWGECPGYSQNVVADFTSLITLFDKTLNTDFATQLPVVDKAVQALPQYLFPNGSIVGFGDTHYGRLRLSSVEDMVRNAQLYHKTGQEKTFTAELKMLRSFGKDAAQQEDHTIQHGKDIEALFAGGQLQLKDTIPAATPGSYITPLFWAPNVSYLAQRNGLDKENGMMISLAGSMGNHAHANGIAMELYGKGQILAPEGGIGTSYFQGDYAEYYSQFPAHNTVCVDGISSYPVMKSNHPFELKNCYPQSGVSKDYFQQVNYAQVYFREPETNADQLRTTGIIRTSDSTGFFVDIFRSHKVNGKDKYHDYIYHNAGQQVSLTDNTGKPLALQPSERLTFADGDVMGYDYWFDKQSVTTSKDVNVQFVLSVPGSRITKTNMWMQGSGDREIFSVKSPPSRSYSHNFPLPDSIADLPLPTVVARQRGEAWGHPFVAVYEPAHETSSVKTIRSFLPEYEKATGIVIQNVNGLENYIFSSADSIEVTHGDMQFNAAYAIVTLKSKDLQYLFLGSGRSVGNAGYGIRSADPVTAILEHKGNNWYFEADKEVQLSIPDEGKAIPDAGFLKENKMITIPGKRIATKQIVYNMPATNYTQVRFTTVH